MKYNPTQLLLDSKRPAPAELVARVKIRLFRKYGVMPGSQSPEERGGLSTNSVNPLQM